MNIEKRNKKYGQGRTYTRIDNKLPIKFDINALDLMCQYVLSENRNIKRGAYINLRNLIDIIDMESYINDQDKYNRIVFIKKGLEAKLEKGLTNPKAIVKYINGGFMDDNIIDIQEFMSMSNGEIDWINDTVSNTLSMSFAYSEAAKGIDLLTKFLHADASNISLTGKEVEEWVASLNTAFRKNRTESVTTEVFSLKSQGLLNKIEEVRTQLTSEYRKLITGMEGMNQLLGGGFENTRCYLFLGITGVGKSLTLLDLAYQIKKYNKDFKPKDPTKIPCIVYLTQENTVTESVDRLFKMATAEDIRNITAEEAVRLMQEDGELFLTDESPIDLIIKYKPNRSVDTGYLYTLTEDLEDEGYEVIMMIQDHVKRIRSVDNNPDLRLELGDVINEMKTFAILKDMPIITISHLNRDGARIIDGASGTTKSDLTRMLGKSNIGESMLMLDNVDFGCILNKVPDPARPDVTYMVFKTIKKRFAALREYICQPYDINNGLKLVEDIGLELPVFRETLDVPMINAGFNNTTQQEQSRYTKNIPTHDEDEDNIFEHATPIMNRYSSIGSDMESEEKPLIKILIHNDDPNDRGIA